MQLLASRQKKKRKRNNASTLAKIHPVAKLQKCHVLRVACWTRRLWIIVLTKICRLLFATYNVTFLTFYNTIPTIILLVYYLKVSLFSSSTCLRAYCHEGPLFVDRMSLIHYHFVALLLLENPFDSPVDVCATLFHKHWPRAGADRTLTKNAKWRKKKRTLVCTTLSCKTPYFWAEHLGCGNIFADQNTLTKEEKKILQMVLGRLEHLYNPNKARLDA